MILMQRHPRRSKLDAIYAHIDVLQAEIRTTEAAPVPKAEHRERVRGYLQRLWTPAGFFQDFSDPERRPDWGRAGGMDPAEAALAVQVMLLGADAVSDSIMARLPNGRAEGLPMAERPVRLETLRAEIANAWREAEREALRIESENGGTDIVDRRAESNRDDLINQAKTMLALWGEMGEHDAPPRSAPAGGPDRAHSMEDAGRELNAGAATSAAAPVAEPEPQAPPQKFRVR